MVKVCDVVTINAPLHPQTENLFNDALLRKMKRGTYLVNTARGKICERDAVVRALESGQPTLAIVDSQTVKSAEKGGQRLIRPDMTRARKSRARNDTRPSIRSAS
jgi:lactate dehydrogenase-like 2-hydroxyacid dehydrogenase